MRVLVFSLLLAALLPLAVAPPVVAQQATDADAIARGVFFFSPYCGHCEQVITDELPGLYDRFGGEPTTTFDQNADPTDVAFYLMSNGTVELLFVDVSVEAGAVLFEADSQRLGLSEAGVPRLDIGATTLVGSVDIPGQLPGIVSAGLAEGGIRWPAVPGLEGALTTVPPHPISDDPSQPIETQAVVPGESLTSASDESTIDRFARDPVGNGLAVLVLLLLGASLLAVLVGRFAPPTAPTWVVPTLAAAGAVVSVYLASVEVSGATAVCGPVGDCNAVQQSEYSSVLGIPIGVLGVLAYASLLAGWVLTRWGRGRTADRATVAIAAVALAGVIFSIYLTFLEPFVIGATCAWCLTSAVVITAVFWVTARPGSMALRRLRGGLPSG